MLPKKYRLKSKKEFDEIFRKGKNIVGNFLTLRTKKGKTGDLKVGFVVSRKLFKKAVKRNRLRRLVQEATRKRINQIRQNYHLVFSVKKEADDKSFQEFESEVELLLEKAKLKKDAQENI